MKKPKNPAPKKSTTKSKNRSPKPKSLSDGIPPNASDDPRQVTVDEVIARKSQEDAINIELVRLQYRGEELRQQIRAEEALVESNKNFTEAVVATVKGDLDAARAAEADAKIQLQESREANATLRRRVEKLQDVVDAAKPFRECPLATEDDDGKTVRCGACQACELDRAVQAYRDEM